MSPTPASIEIEVDGRRRLPLAKIEGVEAHARYRVDAFDDGSMYLTPMESISKREVELLRNPESMAYFNQVASEAINESATGTLMDLPSDR